MKLRDREFRELFDIGLVLKMIEGAVELAAAFLVLSLPRILIEHVANFATAGELSEDPHDLVANWIRSEAHAYAIHAHFLIAGYLFIRGVLKILFSALVLRGYAFAYPLFIIALGLFASYEAYRALTTANVLLGVFALFDTGLMLLTAYESKRRLKFPSL